MNLQFPKSQQEFRQEVRSWLAANKPKEKFQSYDTQDGFNQHKDWEGQLAEAGFSMVTWPKKWGGSDRDLFDWLIFEEEYYASDAPFRINQNGLLLLGPTLMEFGTPKQKETILPRMASCQDMWAQAWSEPNAGSDMAAIRSKAIRHGDGYLINGQKIWSTRALYANWAFGIFRSDPGSERHHGLTYIMVPLDAEGVTIRPIRALNGKAAFAEIFFDDVFVSEDCLIGEEGQGWQVAMATAGFERGLLLRSPARFQKGVEKLVSLAKSNLPKLKDDPIILEQLAASWMDSQAYMLNAYRSVSRYLSGASIGAESSANKVFWSEMDLEIHTLAMRILGAEAEILPESNFWMNSSVDPDQWLDGFLFSQAGPIYAGSNEIQRNIIAERLLGMPR